MSNEVTKPAGVFGARASMVNAEALKSALATSASNDPRGAAADGSVYMNFSGKRGAYEIGTEKRDVEKDELWLVNVPAFEDGWICWKGGRVLANRLSPLGQPVPQVDQTEHGPFTDSGDGWYQAKSMTVRSIDTGEQCYFKINSVSGVSEFAALQKQIIERLMAGKPYWPVIGFGKTAFTSKGYKNFKPLIEVDGWLSDAQVMNDLPAVFEDENAEIDLDALYAAAASGLALPNDGESDEPEEAEEVAEKPKARRNRRSAA